MTPSVCGCTAMSVQSADRRAGVVDAAAVVPVRCRYEGMERFAARTALWADMGAAGLVLKEEPHTLRVPRSQRGGEIVEPLVR